MSTSPRQLHLGLFLFATGYHPAGWRLPEAESAGAFDPAFLQDVARKLEAARFDFFFLGDALASSADMQHQFPSQMVRLEPFTMIAYLAAVTEKIGLIVTANTTYSEPYHIARMTASLDHLSRGRVAWNVVTGADVRAALNFSREQHWDNAKRYDYAEEFVGLVKDLWDTWEEEAFVRDKATGEYVDSSRVHPLHHKGGFFSVAGPLNVARPPQGQIPLLSAGTSERSQELGARYSNALFTADIFLDRARDFYAGIKGKLGRYGRDRSELNILPGLVPLVGRTQEEAHAKYRELNELIVNDYNLADLSRRLDYDLTGYTLDDPLPDLTIRPLAEAYAELAREAAGRRDITIRELFHYYIATVRGHRLVVGSPSYIADHMEKWFTEEACDGFNICPPYMPGGLDLFVELVVPELQKRGLFRKEYSGSTFREHFGLPRPENRFAAGSLPQRQVL